jgi:hypothetical protein
MNNNFNGNYNLNLSNYTNLTETQHTNALQAIKTRRAKMVYEMEMQEYAEAAERKSISDLTNWAESKD